MAVEFVVVFYSVGKYFGEITEQIGELFISEFMIEPLLRGF